MAWSDQARAAAARARKSRKDRGAARAASHAFAKRTGDSFHKTRDPDFHAEVLKRMRKAKGSLTRRYTQAVRGFTKSFGRL